MKILSRRLRDWKPARSEGFRRFKCAPPRFFDFPAEHWQHLRTTNVIESPFATVRLGERATRGASSRTKGRLMAFKLPDIAQQRSRRLDGAHQLPLVRAGAKFVNGVQMRAEADSEHC
jgi:putative transposase